MQQIALCSLDGDIAVYDYTTGLQTAHISVANPIFKLSFRPTVGDIAASVFSSSVVLYTQTLSQLISFNGAAGTVNGAAYSPNGGVFATYTSDGEIIVRQASMPWPVVAPISGHNASVSDVSYSNDSSQLVSISQDATAKLWDISSGMLLQTISLSAGGVSVLYLKTQQLVLTGDMLGNLLVWSPSLQAVKLQLTSAHDMLISSISESYDGKVIATSGYDQMV